MARKWRNPNRGNGIIGQEAEEYLLIRIDARRWGLFTEHDLKRPIRRWVREGRPKPRWWKFWRR